MNRPRTHAPTVFAVAWQWGLFLLILSASLLSPVPAQAQILPSEVSITCTHDGGQWQPLTFYADDFQQLAVGEILNPYWFTIGGTRECNGAVYPTTNYWIMRIQTDGLNYRLPTGITEAGIAPVMGPDGQMYTVYQVPGVPGLGYILQLEYYTHTNSFYVPVNLSAGQQQFRPDFKTYSAYPGHKQTTYSAWFYMSINLILVKTADTPLPTPITVSFEVLEHDLLVQLGIIASNTQPPSGSVPTLTSPSIHTWESASFSFSIEDTWIPPPAPTCTTPAVGPILLDKAARGDFNGIGSFAKEIDFELVFSNCDPIVTSVTYTFAAGGAPSPLPDKGVLPLIAPSTAQGVGVQVLEKNPDWYGTDDYVPSDVSGFGYTWLLSMVPGSDLVLPMRARYLQLEDPIQPGSVHAVLTFVVQFEAMWTCEGPNCEVVIPP